ncbi:hypothetical protein [Streptomyces sp. NPDC003034]
MARAGVMYVLRTGVAWRDVPTETPLAITLTGGNRHDVTQLPPLLDPVPPMRDCGDAPAQAAASVRRPGLRRRQTAVHRLPVTLTVTDGPAF